MENKEEKMSTRQSDHDLLIRVDEKLNILLSAKSDHEVRLRRIELWGATAVGFSYALQFYFNYIKR